MVQQVLSSRVQYIHKTNLSPQVFRIGSNFHQCSGGAFKQDAADERFVLPGNLRDGLREGMPRGPLLRTGFAALTPAIAGLRLGVQHVDDVLVDIWLHPSQRRHQSPNVATERLLDFAAVVGRDNHLIILE